MAQDTTPAIVVYQGDGSNNVFSVPFDKGYYGEVKVLFVRRGLADYTYYPDTYVVNGRLYAWVNSTTYIYTHTPTPAVGAKTYNSSDVEQVDTVSAIAGQTITVDDVVYSRAVQHDISDNLRVTWTGTTLAVGDFICIVRETERGQPYEMPNNQKHIERALDNIERQVQELQSATDSALKIDPSYDIQDSHKMDPANWLKSIIRCMDFSIRALRYANGWLDYSLDDPNIADQDKTWYHLLNTDNIKSIRERSRIEDDRTIYWTEYQAEDGTWKTLCNSEYWDDRIDEAIAIATEAKGIAEGAKETADEAKGIAQDAKDTADGLDGRLILVETGLSTHIGDKNNPHEVTKAQVGLGNVDNTADLDKPVIIKSATIPTASVDLVGKVYQYVGATGAYQHGYIYECVAIPVDSLVFTPNTVSCSWEDLKTFLDGETQYADDVVGGTLTYMADGDIWKLQAVNSESLILVDYQQYTEDWENAGFEFTGTYQDGDVVTFVRNTTTTYGWERIDVQPGGSRGRFLALWNCATGLAESNPPVSPYEYKTGDYFIVGTVSSATPAVNYKPDGSSYVTGVASTTVETNEVSINDTYFYDGTTWKLQSNAQKEVSFSALAGSPYDNTNLATALNSKADTTDIPTVNNATVTINQGGVQKSQFTLNQSSDVTVNLSDGQIIQVDTMPAASATNLGQIVQWIGVTDTYTNGFFYKNVATTTASGTITQTFGASLSDITLDVDTFQEQIDEAGTYVFTFDGSDWNYDGDTVDLSDYGISFSGDPVEDDELTVVITNTTTYGWENILVQRGGVQATYDAGTKTITFA